MISRRLVSGAFDRALEFGDSGLRRVIGNARAALLNPRPPRGLAAGQRSGPVARLTQMMLAQPQATTPDPR